MVKMMEDGDDGNVDGDSGDDGGSSDNHSVSC